MEILQDFTIHTFLELLGIVYILKIIISLFN